MKHKQSYLWRFYAFQFFRAFQFFSAVLLPMYTDWAHLQQWHVQAIQAWFMFWLVVLEIPTGVVADVFGRRKSLLWGAAFGMLAPVVYGSFPYVGLFLLAEFLFALSLSFTSGAQEAWLHDESVKQGNADRMSHVFARMRGFQLLGVLFGGPVGSVIVSHFGLSAPMLFTSLSGIVSFALVYSLPENDLAVQQDTTHLSWREAFLVHWQTYWKTTCSGIGYLRSHSTLRRLTLEMMLVASSAYFVIWLYQPLARSLDVPVTWFGFLHAGLVAIQILISQLFPRIQKRWGESYVMFAALSTSVAFIVAALLPMKVTLLLFLAVAGGFGLTLRDYLSPIMNKHIRSEERSTVLSVISMCREVSFVFLNLGIGWIAAQSLATAFILLAILPLGAAVVYWRFGRDTE